MWLFKPCCTSLASTWNPLQPSTFSPIHEPFQAFALVGLPTMPQVFVHGELIGGSDIALEMLNDGSLREMYDAGKSQG